jgi:hypothetical protein
MRFARRFLSSRATVRRSPAPTLAPSGARVQASATRNGTLHGPRARGQRGATSVAVALSSSAVIGMAALVIDIGQVLVTKAELQMVADLSARSATQELARVYMTAGREDPVSDTLTASEMEQVRAAAKRRSLRNTAGAIPISVNSSDIRIGKWDDATGAFRETNVGVNAVEVRARRDDVANGEVAMFFPAVFGHASVGLEAQAASRMSGIRYLPKGTADFPVAIAKAWYAAHASPCSTGNRITFYPTGTSDSCAGWHTFNRDPASASDLKHILSGLRDGTYESPEIDVEDTQFIFNGGVVASAMNELQQLYNAKKDSKGEMPVLIPVYDREDCANPNGWIRIIGVARAVVTSVTNGADKRIEARVQCDVVELGESGGRDFGVLSAGPDTVH